MVCKTSTLAATLALLATAVGSLAHAAPANGEARLQREIAGRTAGEPVDCIRLSDIRSSRIIDGTAIVFETTGNRLYVNTPPNGASSLDSSYVMIFDTHTPQLCSIDTVRLRDMTAKMDAGFVGLGKFVPYNKIKTP